MNKRNSKTWSERILNAASKEESITMGTLRTRFRIPRTEMDNVSFSGTIMRTARLMAETKLLKRTAAGEFKITKKGLKALNA
jgi:hypothetical protein